jgi:hypothetical protein
MSALAHFNGIPAPLVLARETVTVRVVDANETAAKLDSASLLGFDRLR